MPDRIIQIIAIVLLATVTATSYWYARMLRKPATALPPIPGTPDFTASRLVLTQFDDQGRARYKLFADELLHYAETDNVELTGPRLLSLRPDQPQVEVRANKGTIEGAGERVLMEGQVVVHRAASGLAPALRINTEALVALPDHDRYSTDQPVLVERGDASITAGGMELDNIARTAVFTGRVRTTLAPRAGEPR